MTEDYFKEHVVKALERIADALEVANIRETAKLFSTPPTLQPLPSVPVGGGYGYTCWRCHQWVPTGQAHTCTGYGGGMKFGAGSTVQCGVFGPDGGTCYLPKNHANDCQFAIVTNAPSDTMSA